VLSKEENKMINQKSYDANINEAAAHITDVLSNLLNVNTIFVASNDGITNVIMKAFNRHVQLVNEGDSLPFELSYCSLVLKNNNQPLIIHNTTGSSLTSNMAVTQTLGSRSFIGVPIILKNGDTFGTVCALDTHAYHFSDTDIKTLQSMAEFLAYAVDLEDTLAELKKTEQKLLQANKEIEQSVQLKSNLLDTIGYEIRVPLTSIIGSADLIQETRMTPEQEEYINIIKMSNHSLLTIVDNILYYSKLEARNIKLEQDPFDLIAAIEYVIQDHSVKAAEKNDQLVFINHLEGVSLVVGDEVKLRQTLSNVIFNTIEYTNNEKVVVSVMDVPAGAHKGIGLKFEVTGTGIGIVPETLVDLFQTQTNLIEAGTVQNYTGASISLAISKRLIEIMGGTIRAEATEDNRTITSFIIPVNKYAI
jgi:signal transduction histidine kinase